MKISLNGNRTFSVIGIDGIRAQEIINQFTYEYRANEYDFQRKVWVFNKVPRKATIPTIVDGKLTFPEGYIYAFTNMMYTELDKENLEYVVDHFKNKEIIISDYLGLEDKDNAHDNLNSLIKYRHGIMQIPTGSGKTEMIVVLAHNALAKGMKVLICCEHSPVLNEIRDRFAKYNISIPKYFDKSSPLNAVKPSGFCRNGLYNNESIDEYFSKVDMLISDEVETVTTTSFRKLTDVMTNCRYWYGFSASANKLASTGIPKTSKLMTIMNGAVNNTVSYFGFTAVDERPTKYNITIRTARLPFKIHKDLADRQVIIDRVMKSGIFIWYVQKVLEENKTLFIPINKKSILYNLLENDRIKPYKTLMISGDGYWVYQYGIGNGYTVTLEEGKRLVQEGEIKLVIGTASIYRGIDFHGIDIIMPTFDTQSAIVKQCIGRLTRSNTFEIILINPNDKIHFLTSGYNKMLSEIKNYYGKCNITYTSFVWK